MPRAINARTEAVTLSIYSVTRQLACARTLYSGEMRTRASLKAAGVEASYSPHRMYGIETRPEATRRDFNVNNPRVLVKAERVLKRGEESRVVRHHRACVAIRSAKKSCGADQRKS